MCMCCTRLRLFAGHRASAIVSCKLRCARCSAHACPHSTPLHHASKQPAFLRSVHHSHRARGPEALADPSLHMPGRYMHLSAEDLRLREVPDVLADYQMLYATHASMAEQAGAAAAAAAAGGGSGARPATPVL